MFKPIRNSLSNNPIQEIPISTNNEPFVLKKLLNQTQSINKKYKSK